MRGQLQEQRLETSLARGSKQGTNIHTHSRNMEVKGDVDDQTGSDWLHLEGKMQSLKERPEVKQDYVHKVRLTINLSVFEQKATYKFTLYLRLHRKQTSVRRHKSREFQQRM
jgi:hypothetical protein